MGTFYASVAYHENEKALRQNVLQNWMVLVVCIRKCIHVLLVLHDAIS